MIMRYYSKREGLNLSFNHYGTLNVVKVDSSSPIWFDGVESRIILDYVYI